MYTPDNRFHTNSPDQRARSPNISTASRSPHTRRRSREKSRERHKLTPEPPLTGWLPRFRHDDSGNVYQSVSMVMDEERRPLRHLGPASRPMPTPSPLRIAAGSGQDTPMISRSGLHSAALEIDSRANNRSTLATRRQLRKAAKTRKKTLDSGEQVEGGGSQPQSGHQGPLGLWGFLVQNWMLSWMFVFIPVGFVAYHLRLGAVPVFCANFLAIVPQAWIMGKATEDFAASSGNIVGGLLNAWFGNIVEMLLCIAGLRQGELVVVRCTLIGSILSNLLLVTGCSLFAGGLRYKIQQFSAIGASTTSSLLMLGSFCAGLPTMYASVAANGAEEALKMSRVVAFFLVALYLQYMLFQLNTHSFLYTDEDDDEGDMTPWVAGGVLGVCTVVCAFNSEYLISSISGVVSKWAVSKEFVGIILLPIIGNAAEHYTSVVVALSNKMDLSLGCAVGSSCQMLLFVTPVTILIGWVFGQPMSLDLHAFEVMILIISVVIITGILQDGYSNWLEGSILVSAYAVIAVVFFYEDPRMSDIL